MLYQPSAALFSKISALASAIKKGYQSKTTHLKINNLCYSTICLKRIEWNH